MKIKIVLDLYFNCARTMFSLFSAYVSNLMTKIMYVSIVLDLCFDFSEQIWICFDFVLNLKLLFDRGVSAGNLRIFDF